jgi:hypothetical protein
MKLTPWFPGTVKPVRVGVYERQYSLMWSTRLYCYWNGIRWSPVATSIQEAEELKPFASASQDLPWRGVLK